MEAHWDASSATIQQKPIEESRLVESELSIPFCHDKKFSVLET